MTDEIADKVEQLIASGYRRLSYRLGTVARIDRPDWQQVLATYLGCQVRAIEQIRKARPGELEDYYRRVLSKDCVRLSADEVVRVPTSSFSDTGFVEIPTPDHEHSPGSLTPRF